MLRRPCAALALLAICFACAPAGPAQGKSPPRRRSSPSPRGRHARRAASAAVKHTRQSRAVPPPGLAYAQRGFQLYEQHALPQAIRQFRQASRMEPRNSHFRAVLGDLYAERRELERAANEYRAAIMLAPWDTSLYERLGVTYERMDQPRQAASVYKNVIWIEARDAAAHQHLGWALERQGKRQEAILAYQRALRIDPNNLTARSRLQRLQPSMPQVAHRPRRLRTAQR
jgi:tetratricopeptide (TPR) repeat protein